MLCVAQELEHQSAPAGRKDRHASIGLEAQCFKPSALQPDFGERLPEERVSGEFDLNGPSELRFGIHPNMQPASSRRIEAKN